MKEMFDLLLLAVSAVSLLLWVLLAAVDRLRSTPHKPKKNREERVLCPHCGYLANAVSVICPRCGKQLVIRTTRKGNRRGERFYGCSAYPHCRYTETLYDENNKTPSN